MQVWQFLFPWFAFIFFLCGDLQVVLERYCSTEHDSLEITEIITSALHVGMKYKNGR